MKVEYSIIGATGVKHKRKWTHDFTEVINDVSRGLPLHPHPLQLTPDMRTFSNCLGRLLFRWKKTAIDFLSMTRKQMGIIRKRIEKL